jgi:hypothetical protein
MVFQGMRKKTYPEVDAVIDSLFTVMVSRAPRRPTPVNRDPAVPNCERVVLPFTRMRKRWKKREPVPHDTQTFAKILQDHGVYVFAVLPGHVECQAAQSKIARALGS